VHQLVFMVPQLLSKLKAAVCPGMAGAYYTVCVSICSRLYLVGATRDVAVNSALIDCLAAQQASCSYQPFNYSRLSQVSSDTPNACIYHKQNIAQRAGSW
jgi:hypothetical protein